jgi:hypothetical protein
LDPDRPGYPWQVDYWRQVITFEVPEEAVLPFECTVDGDWVRMFRVPARVLNRHVKLAAGCPLCGWQSALRCRRVERWQSQPERFVAPYTPYSRPAVQEAGRTDCVPKNTCFMRRGAAHVTGAVSEQFGEFAR